MTGFAELLSFLSAIWYVYKMEWQQASTWLACCFILGAVRRASRRD